MTMMSCLMNYFLLWLLKGNRVTNIKPPCHYTKTIIKLKRKIRTTLSFPQWIVLLTRVRLFNLSVKRNSFQLTVVSQSALVTS